VQIYIDGQRESITRNTQREAEYAALEIQLGHKKQASSITVGKAIDAYIDSKDGVLSPSTVGVYRKYRRYYMQDIMNMPAKEITPISVQICFNKMAKDGLSPKTLRNAHGLLCAALKPAAPDLVLKTTLPAKQKKIVDLLPVETVISIVRGTNIELPVMLAMCLSLTESEIRGLTVKSIKDGCLTVEQSVVFVDGESIEKAGGKAYERVRRLSIPPYIMRLIEDTDAWKAGEGHIVDITGKAMYYRWTYLLQKTHLPHMSFHALRHMNASVMLALGVPDKYAMERGGWKTNSVMKNIYQHTMQQERAEVERRINEYFEKAIAHEMSHGG
jgi:integrase